MGFEAYCIDGSFDLLQRVDKKLRKEVDDE
jgi:hypothetical protein